MVGAAVILSRFESGRWRRSAQTIVPAIFGGSLPALDTATFGAAYASYLTGDSSNLFLNGSPVAAAAAPALAPAIVASIDVGGNEVDKGAITSITASTEDSIVVTGENLDGNVRIVNRITGVIVPWTTIAATSLEFNQFGVQGMFDVLVNGEVWVSIEVTD